MSNTTLARPYAKAAFAYADASGQLNTWTPVLEKLALVTKDNEFKIFVTDPRTSADQVYQLLKDVAGKSSWFDAIGNFVRLLIENDRVLLLPEIACLFAGLLQQKNNIISVKVVSAFSIPESLQQKLQAGLAKKLHATPACSFTVDPDLIGGVIVYAGDRVLDYSVKTRLQNLYATLEG